MTFVSRHFSRHAFLLWKRNFIALYDVNFGLKIVLLRWSLDYVRYFTWWWSNGLILFTYVHVRYDYASHIKWKLYIYIYFRIFFSLLKSERWLNFTVPGKHVSIISRLFIKFSHSHIINYHGFFIPYLPTDWLSDRPTYIPIYLFVSHKFYYYHQHYNHLFNFKTNLPNDCND